MNRIWKTLLLCCFAVLFATNVSTGENNLPLSGKIISEPDVNPIITIKGNEININLPLPEEQRKIETSWTIICRFHRYDSHGWQDMGYNEEMPAKRTSGRLNTNYVHTGASDKWWARCWAMAEDPDIKLFIEPDSKFCRKNVDGEIAYEFLANMPNAAISVVPKSYPLRR